MAKKRSKLARPEYVNYLISALVGAILVWIVTQSFNLFLTVLIAVFIGNFIAAAIIKLKN
jgi:hypothetical protein